MCVGGGGGKEGVVADMCLCPCDCVVCVCVSHCF